MTSPAGELRLDVHTEPASELVQRLQQGLRGDDPPSLPSRDHHRFAVVLRGDDDAVLGGLLGATMWQWLVIDLLWVDAARRRAGHGTRLLREAERHAQSLGCGDAQLGLFDFQARTFFERHGYVVYARLENFPAGHTHFRLRKRLASDAAAEPAFAGELALLPPELARQSVSSREIVLPLEAAVAAVEALTRQGHRLEAWEGWLELPGGTRTRSLAHMGSFALPLDAARAAATATPQMRAAQARFDRAPELPGAQLFFCLTFGRDAR